MWNTLLLLAIASCVHSQGWDNLNSYNTNQYNPQDNQTGSYRPNVQIPYGAIPVNNDYNNQQSQSNFYQEGFSSDPYNDNDNEVDPQSTASYYANLDYEERYRCPPNWLRFKESCYRFTKSPNRPHNEARKICQAYEADLASVNSPEEHGFIITTLMQIDPQKGSWYVGVHQQTMGYWVNEAGGSQLSGLENAFFDDQQLYNSYNLLPKDYLVYLFSQKDGRWGLSPVEGTQYYHFICEGQVPRLRYLFEEKRSFTYGLDTFDPERIPRGPYFIREPVDTIYDTLRNHHVQLTCIAGGFPAPVYKWFREDYRVDTPVFTEMNPLEDTRFILSGGTLMIYNPDADKDNAKYHCTASNKFGTIRSESIRLSFGFIREFNQKRPIEQGKQYWGKVISCDPPSYYPSVNFLWARNYFPNLVEEDKRVFVSYDGGLYFSALETIDIGNYSCNVMSKVSDAGRNGPFFTLSVYPHSDYQQLKFPNNFPKVFPDAPVVGQEVRLECFSFGYPVPSYNWTRKYGSMPKKAYLSNFDRVLTIPKVGVEDEGEYLCDVRNDRARISNSVFLKVQAEPNFTIPLADKHMDNKGELHWNCEAFGIPDVNYTWWKNGQKLSMDTLEAEDRDRYVIQDNVLIIKYLDPSRDPGMYQCEAKNQLRARYSTGQLRVLSLKPSFKKRPLESETYGAEGGNVTLRCNPEAAPKPTFTWKKDDTVIGAGGKRFITDNENLIIRQLSRDDEGVYTCVAKNQYGADESRGRLIVLRAPRFLARLPPRLSTQVGEVVFLHCNAEIDPALDTAYLWNHNGIRMRDAADPFADKRIQIDGGELTIYNVTLSDVGDYDCIVKSAIGRISSRSQLRIEGPPGPPGGLQVLNIERASLTLEWTDSNSNGRPITHYIVTGRTNWNSTWVVINDRVSNVMEIDRYNGRKRASIATTLLPWSVYEFRVQAVNFLGYGKPSAPSPQFSTPPDKPYVAPSNIGGGGGKIGDLSIKWTPLPQSLQNGPGVHYKIFWRRNGTEVEYQSLLLKEFGNTGRHVVHISQGYFFTPYNVKVQAFNDLGAGPESPVVTIYSAEDMPQVAPQQVYARSYNSTALNVTWNTIDQSRDRLRGKLIGHRLKYWKQVNKEEECIYLLSRRSRNWALIVGLQPDIYYYVKVMAFNSAGEGPESERYLERTYRKAPQKPPSSVNVWAVNPSTVRVVWRYVQPTAEEEPLQGYKVRVWELEQDISTANDTLIHVEQKLEAYVTSLIPGKTYNLRVLAYSNGGDGRMSSPPITFQMADYHSDYSHEGTREGKPTKPSTSRRSSRCSRNRLGEDDDTFEEHCYLSNMDPSKQRLQQSAVSEQLYQEGFSSDPYNDNDNEVDPQSTASYYANLNYEERYRCPPNWLRFKESCYRFTKSPNRPHNEARKICQAYEADLASVNSPEEHGFIITTLMQIDPQKGSWYVGVHQQTMGYWVNEAGGSQLSGLENAFFDDQQLYNSYNLLPKDYLVYLFSQKDGRWGLSPVEGTQYYHFICEGQVPRLRYLFEEKRSFTYGLDTFDPERIPRGPYFIREPVDTIYDTLRNHHVQLTCIAGGFPAPVYKWFREDYRVDTPVFTEMNPLEDTRFILSGGTLMIYNPDADKDNAKYHCTASNKFGTIRSEAIRLSFGFIREFNQKRPIEQGKQYWGKVISCDPPSYYPSVNFLWARNYFPNLVEEDKRVFVSYDGGLRARYSTGQLRVLSLKPSIKKRPLESETYGAEGGNVTLRCNPEAAPKPTFTWKKDDTVIGAGGKRFITDNENLIIRQLSRDDEGVYTCVAKNQYGADESRGRLIVLRAPRFLAI